ncbi:MAG: sigma-54-dependent Fis family transcriptional regulator [Deltaproteobacteria bacterium]|nr:sigma-54-dependent Fis family transcriptional regulator [Deltaproteobacteria bacterium]
MTNPALSILVVDDEELLAKSIVRDLALLGYRAAFAPTADSALALLTQQRFDVLLTDIYMPGANGLSLLEQVQKQKLVRAAFVMSGSLSIETAVTAMRLGAVNVFEKPFSVENFHRSVISHWEPGDSALSCEDAGDLGPWRKKFAPKIVGEDPALLQMLRSMMRVCDVDSNVLILGESGTGKELVARALHAAGRRSNGPFIPLNCAAIPETLVESELFGYAKGAFTGAVAARQGRFAAANKGSIFLDEIGEMDLLTQAKVLRVLQDREFTPVGDSTPQTCNVRVIAATNRALRRRVQEGAFREDLFFRLSVIVLKLPALRERKSDLPLLIENVIRRVNEQNGRRVTGIEPDAMKLLEAHAWPGNVRELENTIERLVVTRASGNINTADLNDIEFGLTETNDTSPPEQPTENDALPLEGIDLKAEVDRHEAAIINRALKTTGGNQKKAAELLRVNRTTLIEKLRRMHSRAV